MINIIKDIQLIEKVYEYDVILFPMSINNSFYVGFTYEIGLHFPYVKEMENETNYGDKRKYGTINITNVDGIDFVACYYHMGGYQKKDDGSFLNYDYLEECIKNVNNTFKGKKVASMILGANKSDGNGDKNKILDIFNRCCDDIDITLFDVIERDFNKEQFKKIAELHKKSVDKTIDPKEYTIKRSNIEWIRRNGIYKEQPEDYVYHPKKREKIDFIGKVIKK